MHIVCPNCHKTNRIPPEKADVVSYCGACGAELFQGHPTELNFATLQRHVQKNEIPVLVDFWAPWCGPCLAMAPAFAEASQKLEPTVRFAKVNTEEHQQVGMIYGIRSIPTMVLFRGGNELARVSGAMNAAQIESWVAQQLK